MAQGHRELRVHAFDQPHVPRVLVHAVDENRLLLGYSSADDALADFETEVQHEIERITLGIGDPELLTGVVEHVHGEHRERRESGNQTRDAPQQLVDVEHGRNFAAELEQGRNELVILGGGTVKQLCHNSSPMDSLTLPLDYAAIEKILPHRYPFLLVDRITELELDKRIVGLKNISANEPYLSPAPSGRLVLPPTILTEVIAQVGAILILAKPENQDRLPFFAGIERVRYRRPVHPGDQVVISVTVKRLRSRMGVLAGEARVDGKVVVEGTMTFALGPR